MMRNAKEIDDQLYVDKTHFKKYDESWRMWFRNSNKNNKYLVWYRKRN